jgi:hypothetical protein
VFEDVGADLPVLFTLREVGAVLTQVFIRHF